MIIIIESCIIKLIHGQLKNGSSPDKLINDVCNQFERSLKDLKAKIHLDIIDLFNQLTKHGFIEQRTLEISETACATPELLSKEYFFSYKETTIQELMKSIPVLAGTGGFDVAGTLGESQPAGAAICDVCL